MMNGLTSFSDRYYKGKFYGPADHNAIKLLFPMASNLFIPHFLSNNLCVE